ncbi:MAG: HlyD family efflux transporter periplasmic adaptor subunit [Balneolales bacterium]
MGVNIMQGILLFTTLLIASCTEENISDAYGQFEAIETTISAEVPGKILSFNVNEGDELEAGLMIGRIDTIQIVFKIEELKASMKAVETQIAQLDAQRDVLLTQLETAKNELSRQESLKQNNATTQQQIENSQGRVNTLDRQIVAMETQKQTIYSELDAFRIRIEQAKDQLHRTFIINPLSGTILIKFAEPNELATTGRPLYRIANLDTMILRVYLSGAQLPQVRLGGNVDVLIDKDDHKNQSLEGTVSWISSKAEFTPRMIQTKEERVTQVYAVKIKVPNPEGRIKIGMPGEANF